MNCESSAFRMAATFVPSDNVLKMTIFIVIAVVAAVTDAPVAYGRHSSTNSKRTIRRTNIWSMQQHKTQPRTKGHFLLIHFFLLSLFLLCVFFVLFEIVEIVVERCCIEHRCIVTR